MFYTLEQVEQLTYKSCQQALENIYKTYDMAKPLVLCDKTVFDNLDNITNTILYLEDRIYKYEHPNYTLLPIEA